MEVYSTVQQDVASKMQQSVDMPEVLGEAPDEYEDWNVAGEQDGEFTAVKEAVRKREKLILRYLELKISITECSLSAAGNLMWRGR